MASAPPTNHQTLYASLFDHAPDGIIILDHQQKTIHMNEVAKKLLVLNGVASQVEDAHSLFRDYHGLLDYQSYETTLKNNSEVHVSLYQFPARSDAKNIRKHSGCQRYHRVQIY